MVSTSNNHETSPLLPSSAASSSGVQFMLPESLKPRNWSRAYRWTCVGVISLYGLMSPVMAAALVPALPAIADDLNVSDKASLGAMISFYLLSWSLTPVILGPLSEVYGRVRLLHMGHFFFMLFNLLPVFAQTGPQLLVLRFLAGGAGSGPLSIGAGIIGDLWAPEERGTSIALYTLGPLLGPAVGPIAAAYISQHYSWRWIFGCATIYLLVTLVLGLCVLKESYLPIIIQRERKAAVRELARRDDDIPCPHLAVSVSSLTLSDTSNEKVHTARQAMMRPFILLWNEPIIQILAIFTAYQFGLNHLTITTFQSLWRDAYQQDMQRASFNYIFIALGFVVGSQATGWLNDTLYKRPSKGTGANTTRSPEARTYMMLPASLLVPAGLLAYGWSAEFRLPWLLPDAGAAVYAAGLIMSYQCTQAYVIDCYAASHQAASAMGALILVRAATGFAFPVLAPALFDAWGYGPGCSWLAAGAAVMGLAVPLWLMAQGPDLRARSAYAASE